MFSSDYISNVLISDDDTIIETKDGIFEYPTSMFSNLLQISENTVDNLEDVELDSKVLAGN